MTAQLAATLYVGSPAEEEAAVKTLEGTGLQCHVIHVSLHEPAFKTPTLVCYWGVFEGVTEMGSLRRIVFPKLSSRPFGNPA